jgi:hypothetical protein
MSQPLTKTTVDCSTGKVEHLELTAQELSERQDRLTAAEAKRADQQAIADQTALDAQAGRDALVALGLTEAQITALVGA